MSANRIQLSNDYVKDEALAAAALSPGHIVERTSANKVQKHSTEGGFAQVAVAVEDALRGRPVTTAYASGERVTFHIQQRGAKFQGMLKSGENVSIGDALISDGAGRLIAVASASSGTTVKQIICYALEASDQSGSDGEDTLIAVRAA